MKNIKQLAALTALLTLANPAKAEEKDFTPMGTAEDMDSIALVNGQIMVKPQNENIPYYFVNTSTNNFADKAFANADMTNLNSKVISEDAIWATRNGKLLKYPFAQNALNNVPTQIGTNNLTDVAQVISANGNDVVAFDKNGILSTYHIDGATATKNSGSSTNFTFGTNTFNAIATGRLSATDTIEIGIYNGNGDQLAYWSNMTNAPKSLVAFDKNHVFLLTEDGKVYDNSWRIQHPDNAIMSGIDSLTATADGKQLIVKNNEGKVISYALDENGHLPIDQNKQLVGTELFNPTTPVEPQKEFTSKGIRYYISSTNNKKLGWSRAD